MSKMKWYYLHLFVALKLLVAHVDSEESETIHAKESKHSETFMQLLVKLLETTDFPADCPIIYGFDEFDAMRLFISPFRYPYRLWMLFSPPVTEDTAPLSPEENVTVTYGYPWNYKPLSKDIGSCALFLLHFQDKSDLDSIVEYIPTIAKINWGRHYFLLINEEPVNWNEGFVEDILLNSTVTSVMKYKIFPIINEDRLEIYTACFFCNGGYPMVVNLVTQQSGLESTSMKSIYPDYTRNMNNTHLTGVFVDQLTKLDAQKMSQNRESLFIPNLYILLISEGLNFNFSIYRIDIGLSGAFNRRMDDGMWVGLAGDVLYGKADFAFGVIPTSEILEFVNIAVSLADTRFIIIGSEPKTYFSPWMLLKAFGVGLWIVIIVTVLVTTIVFGYSLEKEMSNYSLFNRYSYAFYFILLSAIGCPFSMPNRDTSRVLLTFWLLSCIIISFSYQSNLASVMTVPSKLQVSTTYLEIIEMNYKYGGSSLVNAFFQFLTSESKIAHISEIRDNIINFDTIKECFEASLKSKLVCITAPEVGIPDLYNFLDEDYLPQLHPRFQSGLSLSANSVFRKGFVGLENYNRVLRNCRESGLFQFWERELLSRNLFSGLKKKRNEGNVQKQIVSNSKWSQLNLKQISAPFIILIFGIVLAMLLFLFEMVSKFLN